MPECIDDGIGFTTEDEAAENVFEDVVIEETPSDEIEEVSPEEAAAATIPPPEDEGNHLSVTVCDCCLELNLTQKSVILCARCEQPFCLHFASNVDAQYCVNCLSDISMEKSIITKAYVHKNLETGQQSFYRRRAREIKITGLDWLFSQRKIPSLSDTELDLAVEYHRNLQSQMIAEYERRRNEKIHRYAGVKVVFPTASPTSTSTTTTVKKTRTVSKTRATEQLAALIQQMLGSGMTPDQIAKMVAKK